MEKLMVSARRMDTFLKIVAGMLMAAVITCLIMDGIVLVGDALNLDPEMVGTGYYGVDMGVFSFDVVPENSPQPWDSLRQEAVVLLMAAVACFVARLAVKSIRTLLAPMKEGKPFHQEAGRQLQRLGWYTIALGVWIEVTRLVNQLTLSALWKLPELLTSEKITGVHINYGINLTFLLVAAVLFLLARVFRYGAELQMLSDETL